MTITSTSRLAPLLLDSRVRPLKPPLLPFSKILFLGDFSSPFLGLVPPEAGPLVPAMIPHHPWGVLLPP